MEKWKSLTGYPGYAISNLGRVYGEKRERILKARITPAGYYIVDLPVEDEENNKKYKSFYVHRLVADTFVPNDSPETKIAVIFKDGDKLCCLDSNLEWVTKAEARAYAHTLVEKLSTIKQSLDPVDAEFSFGGASYAKIKGKNLWFRYNNLYYKVRSTSPSESIKKRNSIEGKKTTKSGTLGFFIKEDKTWKFMSISKILLERSGHQQPSPKHKVGYKDWDIYNLSPLNLLWETSEEKVARYTKFNPIFKLERLKRAANIQPKKIKLTDGNIKQIIKLRSYGRSLRKLSAMYKISPATISRYLTQWKEKENQESKV